MKSIPKEAIEQQRKQVFEQSATVDIHSACTINDGILKFSNDDLNHFLSIAEQGRETSFFIPASGSGSRMFHFLVDFFQSKEHSEMSRKFLKNLDKFAFYDSIPKKIVEKGSEHDIVRFILGNIGLKFTSKPKGLVPFHKYDSEVRNPFQEYAKLSGKMKMNLHFTVQSKFEKEILESVEYISDGKISISFSEQDVFTNAVCFDEKMQVVERNGALLTRPAGHGALLSNLNKVESDWIFIKNIDNIQHENHSYNTEKRIQLLQGVMASFESDLKALNNNFDASSWSKFNKKYQVFSKQEIQDNSPEYLLEKLNNRPIRICGMVKNEGAPGGGPFWVKTESGVTKQIVEKVQIADNQKNKMQENEHFNPVFILVSKVNFEGKQFDLLNFQNEDQFLRVEKFDQGEIVHYRELPGLWNGSMFDWNSIFVEVPSSVFTPVKTVLDLLHPLHQE